MFIYKIKRASKYINQKAAINCKVKQINLQIHSSQLYSQISVLLLLNHRRDKKLNTLNLAKHNTNNIVDLTDIYKTLQPTEE